MYGRKKGRKPDSDFGAPVAVEEAVDEMAADTDGDASDGAAEGTAGTGMS